MNEILLYALVAGVVGTVLGCVIGIVFGKLSSRFICFSLAIAGGIMLSVVFFDLIPKSFEVCGDVMVGVVGIVWGIVVMVLLNKLTLMFENKFKSKINALSQSVHKNKIITQKERLSFKRTGIFLVFAVALHNIPEGLAIGASNNISSSVGLAMAIIICIHNIPEGLAIALPLKVAEVTNYKIIGFSIIAGAMTVLGGFIAGMICVHATLTAFSLAFAGGAMLQVVLCEMIKESILLDQGELPYYSLMIGVVIGYIIVGFV